MLSKTRTNKLGTLRRDSEIRIEVPVLGRKRNLVLNQGLNSPELSSLSNNSALFNFRSFLTVVLLVICTCTYVKLHFPTILEHKTGFRGFFWKAARIGERLSPWVACGCLAMGVSIIIS